MRAARFFLEGFVERTDSQDHILPKNDTFSPFCGFCRVFPEVSAWNACCELIVERPGLFVIMLRAPSSRRSFGMNLDEQFAKKKDGGAATDGVSRAAFNKICLEYFEEGMRKPARNGNPGSLESGLAQQRRHFLRGRWRDPAVPHDLVALKNLWASMTPEQVAASQDLLEDFSRWKPGPAGRGGERLSRKRGSEDTGSEGELDSSDNNQAPYPPVGADFPAAPRGEALGQHPEIVSPPRKRMATCDMPGRRDLPPHHGRVDGSGPLELLCNVAFNSDQMSSHHLGPDHLHMMDPHLLHHEGGLAADRMVKGEMGHVWHAHHLEPTDLGPAEALGDDEGTLSDEQPPTSLDHHRYPPHHMHDHLSAHPMHRMPSTMGMDYGHAHARMHGRMGGYGQGMHHDDHLMGEGPRREMLPPPSHRPPVPPSLENAWDSPSARPYPAPSRMAGYMHPPRHMSMMHKSPRHGPVLHTSKSPQHGPMANRSPHHGPMRRSPHNGPAGHPGKSPRHAPGGHPSEMRGEMLPPSSNWMKSPALSHMKPKKIPGRYSRAIPGTFLTSYFCENLWTE